MLGLVPAIELGGCLSLGDTVEPIPVILSPCWEQSLQGTHGHSSLQHRAWRQQEPCGG